MTLAVAACGGNDDAPPATESVCDDTIDNDGDGAIDCADADCNATPACMFAEDCDDGADNDSDGDIDCDDADCATAVTCIPETACDDALDNDLDGDTDCADTDCAAALTCIPETVCDDALDNDLDGDVDCADTDCAAVPGCIPETACADGLDNDGDGAIDCADTDCAMSCPETLCADAVDNDGDGNADCADADCAVACIAGCPAGSTAVVIASTDVPKPFGLGMPTTSSAVTVTQTGIVTGVAVGVDITHPWDGDIELRLESPGGVISELSIGNGVDGDNYVDTVFVDSAMTPIFTGMAPFTGSFQPEEPLAAHTGSVTSGAWTLRVVDTFPAADDGTLTSFDLYVCVCNGTSCEVGVACRDGADSDGDTLIDCMDPDCAMDPFCTPEMVCDDGVDNDLDGDIDCLDASCNGIDQCEFPAEVSCDDAFDNDLDGDLDCLDADCAALPFCSAEVDCNDGMDNDADGAADCLDPGCDGIDGCELGTELTCSDGIDNDGSGGIDCVDPDCTSELVCGMTCPTGTTRTVYTATDLPIPTADNTTVVSQITVAATGLVADVGVSIDIDHAFMGALLVSLAAPGGTNDLSSNNGGGGQGYVDTGFLDSAATSITTGTAPFTGTFRPEQPFAALYGTPLDGDWELVVRDNDAFGDIGSVTGFQLVVCACNPSAPGADCEFGEACRDGLDNDGDGLTDCAETACGTDIFCIPETACDDGIDQDLDGEIDCLDDECDGIDGCEFGTETSCGDGFDNDADGALDCIDSDCPACTAVCGNGVIEFPEGCDDGGATGGNGCSATCQDESGWVCSGAPSTCAPGEIEPNEDGAVITGSFGFGGNDFAVANANANGSYDTSEGNIVLVAAISPAGDEDVFAIRNNTATAQSAQFDIWNQALGINVSCGTAGIDTGLNIRNATGGLLASNDDRNSSTDYCSALTFVLAPGQTVYAHVVDYNDDAVIPGYLFQLQWSPVVCGNGTATLPVEECDDGNSINTDACSNTCTLTAPINEVEPNGTVAQATANPLQIASTTIVRGSIPTIGDQDVFRVTVAAGTVLRMETFVGTVGDCVPSTTLTVTLLDAAGATIITDAFGSGVGSCGALTFHVAPGSYFVRVEENVNDATVTKYFLEVDFPNDVGAETEAPNTSGTNDTNMTPDTNLQGPSSAWVFGDHMLFSDNDVYVITVPPFSRIRAELIEGDRAMETCEAFGIDSLLVLFDTAGVQLAQDDDAGRGYCSMIDGQGTTPAFAAARNPTAVPQLMFLHVRRSTLSTMGADAQFLYRLHVTYR